MTIRAKARMSPIVLALLALLAACSGEPTSTQTSSPTSSPGLLSAAGRSGGPSGIRSTDVPPNQVPADYVFPVRSKSARFGRTHHDYPATDIFAPCGSAALAVTAGVVAEVTRKDLWDARENGGVTRGGLSVTIIGTDGVRYYGSHLKSIVDGIVPGHRVHAGELLGWVGDTGSARQTPCHLHFGISPPCATGDWWNRRGVLSPYQFLTSWQGGGQRSPARAVAEWKADHGCPTKPPN